MEKQIASRADAGVNSTSVLKQHGKMMLILALCLCIPFISIWYIVSYVNENIFYEQKRDSLLSVTRVLESQLVGGGYDEILTNAGLKDATREEQIAALNAALREITDDVARSSDGMGVGYYSRELDAILSYGPSANYQQTVGTPIGAEHPGRRVMATGNAEVTMGSMVRGNIMNAMLPIVRGGEVIGYIWANNLVSDLEKNLAQMAAIIRLLLVISYVFMLIIILTFIRRMIRTEQSYMQELSAALTEAQSATQAKSTFLANMSHEIRTPMNAILGITQIQLNNRFLDQNIRDGLEKIDASGDMLLGIINDILDLSKIEAGRLELLPAKYEIASLVSDTVQLNVMRIGGKPIEFDLSVDENMPAYLWGDELRVKQILNNILSNAFKYTMAGTVRMSLSSKAIDGSDNEVMLVISISDSGQGMTSEQVAKLGEEYSRFNQEANRTTEGTGLGMSITRNLIRLMNGELIIESEPGKGSVFTVYLPQGNIYSGVLGAEATDNLHNFRSRNSAQMRRVQITRDPMPYGSVLIVDDVETNIFVAIGLMNPYGLKTDSVDSGFGAIERVKNGCVYDVIFMDHMMPKLDGIETTKIIRSIGYSHPIVALTANAVAGQAEVFLNNGFDEFISKPIDLRRLNAVLNKYVRDKQPPEVIEMARKEMEEKKEPSSENMAQTAVDPQLAEIFMRDALKAHAALEAISEKNDYGSEENLRAYIINMHGIKSALANIGKMDISAAASKLETAGREGRYETIISETPYFLNLLRSFMEELMPLEKTTADVTVDEDKTYLCEKLLAIKAACVEYNENSAYEAFMELKKSAWSKPTKMLLNTIGERLLHSDFDDIVDEINRFIETSGV